MYIYYIYSNEENKYEDFSILSFHFGVNDLRWCSLVHLFDALFQNSPDGHEMIGCTQEYQSINQNKYISLPNKKIQ